MSVTLPFTKQYQTSRGKMELIFTNSIGVTLSEQYKTNPILITTPEYIEYPLGDNMVRVYDYLDTVSYNNNGRAALVLAQSTSSYSILSGAENTASFKSRAESSPSGDISINSGGSIPVVEWAVPLLAVKTKIFATNIPVFETQEDAHAYLSVDSEPGALALLKNTALNYVSGEVQPVDSDFEIINAWTHGTWLNDTQPQVSAVYYRNVRGKLLDGGFALYDIPGITEGKLKIGVLNNATFSDLQYSNDGINWTTTNSFPYEFFLRRRVDETGEFDYGLTFGSNKLPKFDDQETAQGYLDGEVDITEANNWDEISNEYPITNATGEDDPESDFGEVKTKGFFSQQYILDSTCLADLADDLFDTSVGGIWEAIKKGLDMYGDNPIEAVMGLSFWPVDLTTIFQSSPASYIWFGGYGWEPSSGTHQRIVYPNGYKSIGMVRFRRTFNSWRDMEPYTKLYVMLPYCGTYQLDLARYYDKNVEVRYYFDTRTNGCIACLIADGFLVDYFNGQMGVTMPITLTDYSAYMNAQISTLLGGGGQAVQQFGSSAGIVGSLAPAGAVATAAGGAAVGALTGVAGAAIGAKMVYGLSQNNINNFNKTKGGSSSMINEYLPQSVCFIFEIQEDCAPANYGDMFGYPSMKPGKLMNFSGFLKCQSVKLNCPVATERERERFKQMLLSGVYI